MTQAQRFDPGGPVLRHTSGRPAVSLWQDPSAEELAFDWTLSPGDRHLALLHRGEENLLRFALQLCTLRKYGRFLSNYNAISPFILGYLCRQLEIPTRASVSAYTRDNTESDHQQEIVRYLGWRFFDAAAAEELRALGA